MKPTTNAFVDKPLSLFLGLVAIAALFFAAAAPLEANRVPPRPQPPVDPQPERKPAERTYVFDDLESYPDHTFVLSHRRTFPRSDRVDYEAQVVKQGEPVELHFTSDKPRRAHSVVVRLHAVTKELPQDEDGEGVELCHDWLTENSQATFDGTGQFPATTMFMNQEIRAETITYRPVIEEKVGDGFSLRIYRSRSERFDKDGELLFSRDYADPERPLHEQRGAEKQSHHAESKSSTATNAPAGTFLPQHAFSLLLLSGLAGLILLGVVRMRR